MLQLVIQHVTTFISNSDNMASNGQWIRKEQSRTNLRYYSAICLYGLRKTTRAPVGTVGMPINIKPRRLQIAYQNGYAGICSVNTKTNIS
jgi:hypothetical protein